MGRVGETLHEQVRQLAAVGSALQEHAEGELAEHLTTTLGRLDAASFRIAVIGQVKAGKTTLVNGLMRRPGYLPSDVNPWTAVVTRLCFGVPDLPERGAAFDFFDSGEWDRIAERASRIGELSQSFGSAYGPEELREQLDLMRQRAERRLGDKFHHILGKRHKFSEAISPDILERYVCAGDTPRETVRNPVAGRFADITKSAEVYFGREPFGFPLVLVDTPGTNDPLLVREEITRQSLETADIFVLVLSAHQALSDADVTILRLLQALRLDRLVVFVNRIDELTDPKHETPQIVSHVRRILEREMPGHAVPILAGSAAWAEDALCAETEEERSAGFADSGLPGLEDALSAMLLEGPGETLLSSVSHDFSNIAQSIAASHRAHARSCDAYSADLEAGGTKAVDDISAQIRQGHELHAELERAGLALREAFEPVLNEAWSKIRLKLEKEVRTFANNEAGRLRSAMREKAVSKRWHCDVMPLRRSLQRAFLQEFRIVQHRVILRFADAERLAWNLIHDCGVDLAPDIRVNTEELRRFVPSTASLATAVSIDLEISWWRGLLSAIGGAEPPERKLATLIKQEFYDIRESLLSSAMDGFARISSQAVDSFLALQRAAAEFMTERADALVDLQESMAQAEAEGGHEAAIARLRTESERRTAISDRCLEIAAQLSNAPRHAVRAKASKCA